MKFRCRSFFDVETGLEASYLVVRAYELYVFWDLANNAPVQIEDISWPVHADDSASWAILDAWEAEQNVEVGSDFPEEEVEVSGHSMPYSWTVESQTGDYECEETSGTITCDPPLIVERSIIYVSNFYPEASREAHHSEYHDGFCNPEESACDVTRFRGSGSYSKISVTGRSDEIFQSWAEYEGLYSLYWYGQALEVEDWEYEILSSGYSDLNIEATRNRTREEDRSVWPYDVTLSITGNTLRRDVVAQKTARCGVIARAVKKSGDDPVEIRTAIEIAFYPGDVPQSFASWDLSRNSTLENYISNSMAAEGIGYFDITIKTLPVS